MVTSGTGVRANIGDESQWGKTGTTDDNGDAWFCGATDQVTACVWVGYADTNTPMTTEFSGGPVDGGTFPALIWAGVISAWEEHRGRTGGRERESATTIRSRAAARATCPRKRKRRPNRPPNRKGSNRHLRPNPNPKSPLPKKPRRNRAAG